MAGTLRAEATLAAANLVYLLFLVSGGIAVPLDRFPDGGPPGPGLLPAGALSEGLRVGAPRRRPAALVVGRRPRWPGPRSAASSPPAPSAGSSAPYAWVAMLDRSARLDAAARPPYAGCSSAALVANVGIVVTGGAVRLTGSGLGCPTFPRCTDDSLVVDPRDGRPRAGRVRQPDADLRALGRRGGRGASWPGGRGRRDLRALAALLLFGGIVAQAVLGGVTVLTGLNPVTVMAHFLLSVALIAVATRAHVLSARRSGRAPRRRGAPGRAARRSRPARGDRPAAARRHRGDRHPVRTRATRTPPTGCRSTWWRSPSCTPTWSSCSWV